MGDQIVPEVSLLAESSPPSREQIRESITHLYYNHRQAIVRSLAAYSRNPATAEEVTQEAFFRLYQHLIAGNLVEKVLSWTVAVARNLARDRSRSGNREQLISERAWRALVETSADSSDSFEQVLIEHDTHQHLRALVDFLPGPQRRCVELYAQGLTIKEIAAELEIPYHNALLFTRHGLQRVRRLAARKR
jgi:RNA polymerase sigma factor (sigma-70 family)